MTTPPPTQRDASPPPSLQLPAEFRTSLGIRLLFAAAACAACVLLTYFGFIKPFLGASDASLVRHLVLGVVCLGIMGLVVVAAVATHRQRLVITEEGLEMREFIEVRRIPFSDIEGYRPFPQQSGWWIYPKGGGKPLKPGYMARGAELDLWLGENLVDLNRRDAERDEKEILSNEALGCSEPERRVSLARARAWCLFLNVVAFTLTLMGLFYPRPYRYLMVALALMPVLALATGYILSDVVRLDGPKYSGYPTTAISLTMPPLALFLRAFVDFSILDWGRAVLLAGPFALAFAGASLLLSRGRLPGRKAVGVLALALLGEAYGYGVAVQSNVLLDKADAARYRVTVLEKVTKGSKSTEYYFKVTAWGDRAEGEEVSVSRSQYERAEVGSPATVRVKPGLLAIRWYGVVVDAQDPE